jgi:kynurenine formamidase
MRPIPKTRYFEIMTALAEVTADVVYWGEKSEREMNSLYFTQKLGRRLAQNEQKAHGFDMPETSKKGN